MLEVVAAKAATRRAIVEGLKQALRSADSSTALNLSLPDYFNQVAQFTLLNTSYIEDQDAVRNRRRAHLTIELYVPEVLLANAVTMKPFITVQTQLTVLDTRVTVTP